MLARGRQYPDALNDALSALRYIRSHAEELNIDPDKVGMMGFSAGGHLTAQVAEKATEADVRLNFAVPVYPVVTMIQEPYVHKRSRRALLGEWRKHDKRWREEMSLEKHQCDANLLLADVLDVTTGQESGLVSKKLLALPPEEQRRILRVVEIMIDETGSK